MAERSKHTKGPADELRKLREDCEWSQEELAAILGVTRSAVFHWERRTAPVPPEVLRALRNASTKVARLRGQLESAKSAAAFDLPTWKAGGWQESKKAG